MRTDPIRSYYIRRNAELLEKLKKYKPPRQHFVASQLGMCRLALWFEQSGYLPSVKTARDDDYGNDGDMHHDAVRRFMQSIGLKIDDVKFREDGTVEETGVYVLDLKHKGKKFRISMRLDGKVKTGTVRRTLEIKSIGYWKLKPIVDVWTNTESETAVLAWLLQNRKDIIYQVHANMVATGLKSTYLVIKSRSECYTGLHSSKNPDSILGGIVVPFSDNVWQGILNKLAFVQKHLDSKTEPEPDFIEPSKECDYCKYQHLCHGAAKREKKGLSPARLHPQLGTILHADQLR